MILDFSSFARKEDFRRGLLGRALARCALLRGGLDGRSHPSELGRSCSSVILDDVASLYVEQDIDLFCRRSHESSPLVLVAPRQRCGRPA